MKCIGTVTLVGAGPGDPDLLTVKAVKAISLAEVVVFDRLVAPAILDLIPSGALRVDVGKQPKRHPVPQHEINLMLVQHARAGRKVVRLKGGDPYIFGRGSEEAIELQRHGIPFSVIPGITSAQGASASLGVPLTHRGLATSVRYVTGHCREDMDLDLDWNGLADPRTTVVVYMGLANIAEIVTRLLDAGRGAATPVLVVNNATLPAVRTFQSTLGAVCGDLRQTAFDGPVLFMIGEVVSLRGVLSKEGVLADAAAPVLAGR